MSKRLIVGVLPLLVVFLLSVSCAVTLSSISDGVVEVVNKTDHKISLTLADSFKPRHFTVDPQSVFRYHVSAAGYQEDYSITIKVEGNIVARTVFTVKESYRSRTKKIYHFTFKEVKKETSDEETKKETSEFTLVKENVTNRY